MEEWYYTVGDQQMGPVPYEELLQRWSNGALGGDELVWKAGMEDWVPVAEVFDSIPAVSAEPIAVGASHEAYEYEEEWVPLPPDHREWQLWLVGLGILVFAADAVWTLGTRIAAQLSGNVLAYHSGVLFSNEGWLGMAVAVVWVIYSAYLLLQFFKSKKEFPEQMLSWCILVATAGFYPAAAYGFTLRNTLFGFAVLSVTMAILVYLATAEHVDEVFVK